jgi:hypothetical protein
LVASTSVSKPTGLSHRVISVADIISLTAGDYVTFVVYHIESSNLLADANVSIMRLS